VLPLLRVLEQTRGVQYVHRHCSTKPELAYNLRKLGEHSSYQLVYLAFHGSSSMVHLRDEPAKDDASTSLRELARLMGQHYEGRVVHFATCATISHEPTVRSFMDETGLAMVSGFTRSVDWLQGASLEMLYFGLWQEFHSVVKFDKRFKTEYPDLVRYLGYESYLAK
jgi:hypothetical protein